MDLLAAALSHQLLQFGPEAGEDANPPEAIGRDHHIGECKDASCLILILLRKVTECHLGLNEILGRILSASRPQNGPDIGCRNPGLKWVICSQSDLRCSRTRTESIIHHP